MLKRQPPSPGRDSLARRTIVKEMQKNIKDLGFTNKEITVVLNAFLEIYKKALLDHNRVEIRNFGTITKTLVPARAILHPETHEETLAAPYYKIAFMPSASFRKKLKDQAKEEITKI